MNADAGTIESQITRKMPTEFYLHITAKILIKNLIILMKCKKQYFENLFQVELRMNKF